MWVWWPVADVREWVQAKPTNQIKCSQLFSLLTMSEPRSLVTTLTELVLSRQAEQREWKWVWSCVTQCMNHVAQSSSLRSSHAQHFSLSQPCYQTLPAHTTHTQLSCLRHMRQWWKIFDMKLSLFYMVTEQSLVWDTRTFILMAIFQRLEHRLKIDWSTIVWSW